MPTPLSQSTGVSSRHAYLDGPDSHVPSSSVLNLFSREEPDSSDGSSADEAAPLKTAGWRGTGKPMEVALASPGRWCPEECRYPATSLWKAASGRSWISRADTGRQLFSLVWPLVWSQNGRLKNRQWRDSRSKLSMHWQSRVST